MQTRFLKGRFLKRELEYSLVSVLIIYTTDCWPGLVMTPRLGEGGQFSGVGHVPRITEYFGKGVRSHLKERIIDESDNDSHLSQI